MKGVMSLKSFNTRNIAGLDGGLTGDLKDKGGGAMGGVMR